jgi:hypothetical protein
MKAISPRSESGDIRMAEGEDDDSMAFFKHAQRLSNATLKIVLQRIGDPNVLPFIHVTLLFIYNMSRHPGAMELLEVDFPWDLLTVMLNTLMASYGMPATRIESDEFPMPEKDDKRPFPEDFAMRGLLWAENYFPDAWFANEKVDEEEKYHERASMTAQRKERILWLACKIASRGPWISYAGRQFSAGLGSVEPVTRSMTFASATTYNTKADTWSPMKSEFGSDAEAEKDSSSPATLAASTSPHD